MSAWQEIQDLNSLSMNNGAIRYAAKMLGSEVRIEHEACSGALEDEEELYLLVTGWTVRLDYLNTGEIGEDETWQDWRDRYRYIVLATRGDERIDAVCKHPAHLGNWIRKHCG